MPLPIDEIVLDVNDDESGVTGIDGLFQRNQYLFPFPDIIGREIACIIGGLGNPFGAAAGGILLGILESLCAGVISSAYKDAFAFFVLLILLFVKPSGLFGQAKIERV